MNHVGQGSQYVVLTVTDFKDALKAVTSWNAEGKWKVKKMMNLIKETGKVLLVGVVTISPFALHVLGVI
jgi:hypothetical protein